MATLELRHVSMVYRGGDRAVDDLDLVVDDGELVVLVGPSGAGKTTVLRIVGGFETPTTGDVLIDGESVMGQDPRDRDVAMAFQDYVLYPHLTVAENIGFSLKMHRVPQAELERRVRDIARLLDVDDLLDRRPRTLSGGQRQRVALGRAIIRSPRLFLMDEPLSNLDTKRRIEARAEIMAIQRRLRITTLHVTHDQGEAMAMADRLGVMRRGRLLQVGTPLDVYARPADLFVARFIGSPPMTVLEADLVAEGEDVVVDAGRWSVPVRPETIAARPALRSLVGRRIGFGFRPESLQPDSVGPIVADVTSIEALGPDQVVHATVAGTPAAATPGGGEDDADEDEIAGDAGDADLRRGRAPVAVVLGAHRRVDRWQPLRLALDVDSAHFFDLDTGDALASPPSPG